jgi:hypothetical protein
VEEHRGSGCRKKRSETLEYQKLEEKSEIPKQNESIREEKWKIMKLERLKDF